MVGFKVKNLEDIKSIYYCPCCSLLLRDPVQLIDCGHRQCQSCLDDQQGDMIICSECHDKISREKLKPDRGFRNDMQTLSIICAFCKWTDILKNYQNHLNHNHSNPICHYCNEKFSSVNDLNRHQQLICDKIMICCPFEPIGCDEMILRANLSKHYSSEQHQQVLVNFIVQYQKRNFHQTAHITSNHFKDIDETIDVLSNSTVALNEDIKRLGIEFVQIQNTLQSIAQELPLVKESIDEHNTFVDSMQPNQEMFELDILSMKQQLNGINSISYDGTYIWKITNVQERTVAAQSETQTTIDSPPFYSSPNGYKMCLRMYLNGDGNARHTHISLFFILMRGEYDAILKFPFCFNVIFCLYDQINPQNSIIDVLRPNVLSNNVQRPRSDINLIGGIPKFASLETIRQTDNRYILDDTMFIKVVVDFGNMPKDILSYALGLSPGLTNQIHQSMIRQEIEKRQQ